MIAVDVGNTKTAIGFFRDGVLTRTWRIGTDLKQTSDQYRAYIHSFLSSVGETLKSSECLILSSVVPEATTEWEHLRDEIDIHVVTFKTPISFEIAIVEPSSLGTDRIASAEAAVRKYGVPAIIIDAGTALTLAAVNAKKQFIGGTIAPGIGISLKALFDSAARLSQIDLAPPQRVIGATTKAAIESGIYYGYSAMINGLIEKFTEELGAKNASIVATGGSIRWLAPYLKTSIKIEPTLTLEGLYFLSGNLKTKKAKHV